MTPVSDKSNRYSNRDIDISEPDDPPNRWWSKPVDMERVADFVAVLYVIGFALVLFGLI